jgi:hypothetical protein
MRRFLPVALVLMLLAMPAVARPQGASDAGHKNAGQAREVLDAMVRALGGEAWLNTKNQMRQGNLAAFIHGEPSGGATEFREYHAWPDHDRIEFGKRRDVVQFFVGRAGTEVTYKGKAPLPQEQVDDLLRRRDHSFETAVKIWLNDPRTILIYEGRQLAERHLADQVTLISAENEAVTILADVETHLPLRRTFEWRDPVYKDKNLDAEEYDNYHTIDGLPTPLTITRFKNGDVTRQFFLTHVTYNQKLPDDFWSVDTAERRMRK